MDDDPGSFNIEADVAQQPADAGQGGGRDPQGEALVHRRAANAGDQVELSADFVPDAVRRFWIGHPVGQELVGILMAVGQSQWDVGQVAQAR
jgi:hypothetical protein